MPSHPARRPLRSPADATRRRFLGGTLSAGTALVGAIAAPAIVRAENRAEQLRMAVIGCGGRVGGNLDAVSGEEIVAVCDVNAKTLAGALAKAPKAKAFTDYRQLYED
ncbi:MAG: gfo/Idh/MocA family oxidoreductase, partial [Planctomycetaceae bacterium]